MRTSQVLKMYISFLSQDFPFFFCSALHVLYDQVSSAEVNETLNLVFICELKMVQHVLKPLFAVWLVGNIPIGLDYTEAFYELWLTVAFYHVAFELGEVTA